jgi:hypothetical protein
MRAKSISDHNRVVRLEDWNGLDLTGSNDCSSILTAAMTQAAAAKYPVTGPSGTLLIGTTVTANAPLIGPSWPRGSTNAGLWLKPGMTDGAAVLSYVLANGFHFENIGIDSGAANPGAAVNAIGIKLGTVGGGGAGGSGTASRYGVLRNIHVNGLATAYEIQGWSSQFLNLFAYNCTLGLNGEYLNNCLIDLICGGCVQGFTITNTGSLVFTRFGDEGSYGTAASTINSSEDVVFNSYRTEQAGRGAVPWLTVGSSSPNIVRNLRILSGVFDDPAAGVAPVELDYVDGWEISARISNHTTNRRSVSTTVNTRNNHKSAPRMYAGYPFVPQSAEAAITDNRRDFQRPVELFNANPFMDGVRFGCYNVVASASTGAITLTEDTTIYRTGSSSLRVEATTGGTSQRAEFYYNDPWVPALAGQLITFGAWIKTPNETDIKGEETADGTTIYPAITLRNAAGTVIGNSDNGWVVRAGWSFLHCTATIPAAATEFRAEVWLNRGANNTAIGDHINIDFMGIAAGDVWEQIYEGNFVQSQLCTGSFLGGRALWRLTQAAAATLIADTTQVYKVGDTIEYTDPAAAGNKGIVCTTGGAGGTAVFKAFGVIEAP